MTPKTTGPPGRPLLPPEAEDEILTALFANMRISSGEIAASSEEIPLCSVPALRRGLRPLHSFLLSHRNRCAGLQWGPQASPAERVAWGKEEQRNE